MLMVNENYGQLTVLVDDFTIILSTVSSSFDESIVLPFSLRICSPKFSLLGVLTNA